jgi:hypothetical protein
VWLDVRNSRASVSVVGAFVEPALAVVAEGGVIPDPIVDGPSDEPAEPPVAVDRLDEWALRAHRVEELDPQRPQQKRRRYRRSPALGGHHGKVRVHRRQHRVDPKAVVFKEDVAKIRSRLGCC